ncbi:2-dehydro-3-deoxy-6-phosphogalactonate aldolase [Marinomonas epiphytica]
MVSDLQHYFMGCPLIAILRGITPQEVLAHGQALYEAGFRVIEVPLNSPEPFESIQLLQDHFAGKALIGAGTVLQSEQVNHLAATGAGLMVCPHTDELLIRQAKAAGLLALPGFLSPTEAFKALQAGADGLKLFPAEALPSTSVIKALRAVLPKDVPLCPVGGVSPSNMAEYLQQGASGFGLGSALYRAGQEVQQTQVRAEAFITELARYRQSDQIQD